jgi:hypothetical protein
MTDRVLSDAVGGAPTQKDKTAWFRANRSSVERVASNKFDMGAFEKDGFARIVRYLLRDLFNRHSSATVTTLIKRCGRISVMHRAIC